MSPPARVAAFLAAPGLVAAGAAAARVATAAFTEEVR